MPAINLDKRGFSAWFDSASILSIMMSKHHLIDCRTEAFSVERWFAGLAMLLGCIPLSWASAGEGLTLTRGVDEWVITSHRAPTWRVVMSVAREASGNLPGGGTIRALHIPADNPESVVETDPSQFEAAWGMDSLEWRYVPKDAKWGVRKPMGKAAMIEKLDVLKETDSEIVIEMYGHWENVPRFTRRVVFDPGGWHTVITTDWDGPDDSYGMWWIWTCFETPWMDNENVTIEDSDTSAIPLPVFRGNVRRVPDEIDFPYTIQFPLMRGPVPHLRLRVVEFGADSHRGPLYELWPEAVSRHARNPTKTSKIFMPRWVAGGIAKQTYVFDYEWRVLDE